MQAHDQSGLVLGGGGITGIAWELGLLAGLAPASVDLLSADVIIGTSAGSVVGAQITSSTLLEALYLRQLEPSSSELPARLGPRGRLVYLAALLRARGDLIKFGRRLGAMSLRAASAGRVPTVDQRLAVIRSRLPSTEWPERDLRVTAVDARSGEFRVITRADGVPLVDAVAASCAVPGVWPPVTIGSRRYIDGGMRSRANADLAAGYDLVLVLAPMVDPALDDQLALIRSTGRVETLSPDDASVAAFGPDPLDPSVRSPVARAGLAQGEQAAAVLDDYWKTETKTKTD